MTPCGDKCLGDTDPRGERLLGDSDLSLLDPGDSLAASKPSTKKNTQKGDQPILSKSEVQVVPELGDILLANISCFNLKAIKKLLLVGLVVGHKNYTT